MDPISPGQFTYHYLVGEVASLLAIIGALVSWLPAVATALAIMWYVILIIESRTGAAMLARLRIRREAIVARVSIQEAAHEARATVKEQALIATETIKEQATIAAEQLRDKLP